MFIIFVLFIFLFEVKSDVLSDQINSLKAKVCPYVNMKGANGCGSTKAMPGNGIGYQLLTFNALTGESAYPIIDLDSSKNVQNQDFTNNVQQKCIPQTFSSTDDFYSKFYNLDQIISTNDWEYYNGMFEQQDIDNTLSMFQKMIGSQERQMFVVNQQLFITHHISVEKGNIALNDEFTQIVNQYLPTAYDADKYRLFVENFGTHAAIHCDFGGLIEQDLFVQQCSKDRLFANTFNNDMCSDLSSYINDPSKGLRGGSKNYQDSSTVYTSRIAGGNPVLEASSQWKQRIGTFAQDPVAIRCEFSPISDFVGDASKKANLQKYIKDYVANLHAKRDAQFAKIRAQTTIPIWFVTNLPGGGFEYAPLMGTLPNSKVNSGTIPYHFHISWRRNIDDTEDADDEYDEDIEYDIMYYNATGREPLSSRRKGHEDGSGSPTIYCACKSDRTCGCWQAGYWDSKHNQMVTWLNDLCYPAFGKVLSQSNVQYVKSGLIDSSCVPSMADELDYLNGVPKERLPPPIGVIHSYIGCEHVTYNNGFHCDCQIN